MAGYVIAARMLDKCRAVVAGTAGEYKFNCPLDRRFLDFAGIDADAFREYVVTGASDEEVAAWIEEHSTVKDRAEIVRWNNQMRALRVCDLPIEAQMFLEDYIPRYVPRNRPVYVWFDVYDLEEGRL